MTQYKEQIHDVSTKKPKDWKAEIIYHIFSLIFQILFLHSATKLNSNVNLIINVSKKNSNVMGMQIVKTGAMKMIVLKYLGHVLLENSSKYTFDLHKMCVRRRKNI